MKHYILLELQKVEHVWENESRQVNNENVGNMHTDHLSDSHTFSCYITLMIFLLGYHFRYNNIILGKSPILNIKFKVQVSTC